MYMPEYKCECCDFKTIDKGKYLKHNETNKHLKKMESFVKVCETPLQAKVDMLEQTIQLLIKRIEVLQNKQDISQVVEQAIEPVVSKKIEPIKEPVEELVKEPVEEPLDIDMVINHIQEQTYFNFDDYKTFVNDIELTDMESYVKDKLDEITQQKIANGEVVYPLLKDTYDSNSEKAIFNKICNLIPKESIKVNDISRTKFSLFCGEWLNSVKSTEKIELLIDELQLYIGNLHNIYSSCKDMYCIDADVYVKLNEKVYQGDEAKSKILKLILTHYKT